MVLLTKLGSSRRAHVGGMEEAETAISPWYLFELPLNYLRRMSTDG